MSVQLKNILIVNPLFGDLFINSSRENLKDQFVVEEFFIKGKAKGKSYSKLFHKIVNILNIQLFKRRDYYHRLQKKKQNRYYTLCLKNIKNKKYDKILFCRGDRLPDFVLRQLYTQGKQLINYQCDGVEMCPDIFSKSKFFSSIFSFEKRDLSLYPELQLKFITNFYFSHFKVNEEVIYDFFYIGTGLAERVRILEKLFHILPKQRMHLMIGSQKQNESSPLIFLSGILPYEENIRNVMKSKCLIDIKMDVHNGLSFRFFEALYFRKKLITNNKDVIHYDFYHPHNILIVDYDSINGDEILNFMNLEYFNIDTDIVEHYSFNSWLHQILGE